MNRNTFWLGAAVIALLATSLGLWREIGAERQRSAALLARLGDAGKRIESLKLQLIQSPPPSIQAIAPTNSPLNVAAVDIPSYRVLTPEVAALARKSLAAQTRLQIPQGYPDLMEELGLTPEQLSRLFDLLVKQQDEHRNNDDTLKDVDEAERRRSSAELERRQKQELSALLGNKLSQFEEYKVTQPARRKAGDLRRTMELSGLGLRDDQDRMLKNTMIAEYQRLQNEERDLARERAQGLQTPERYEKSLFDLRAEGDRRVLSAAGTYLTEPQLQIVRLQIQSRIPVNRPSFQSPPAESK